MMRADSFCEGLRANWISESVRRFLPNVCSLTGVTDYFAIEDSPDLIGEGKKKKKKKKREKTIATREFDLVSL